MTLLLLKVNLSDDDDDLLDCGLPGKSTSSSWNMKVSKIEPAKLTKHKMSDNHHPIYKPINMLVMTWIRVLTKVNRPTKLSVG